MKLEHSTSWQGMSLNHLEGRTAAVFCYGDGGGNELDPTGRPRLLKDSHKHYFNPEQEPFENERDIYAPLVWQCRYGGIEVPDALWHDVQFGKNEAYSDNQAEDLPRHKEVFPELDAWTDRLISFVEAKGKVEPGQISRLWLQTAWPLASTMSRLGVAGHSDAVRKSACPFFTQRDNNVWT